MSTQRHNDHVTGEVIGVVGVGDALVAQMGLGLVSGRETALVSWLELVVVLGLVLGVQIV